MIKYTSNEQYEMEKARVIDKLSRHLHNKSIMRSESIFTNDILDLLKQSKWIGNDDDDNSTLPIPVKKDMYGKFITDYTRHDWFRSLNSALDDVKSECYCNIDSILNDILKKRFIARKLQNLITVCTSYLDFLGFDEAARIELTKRVNEQNRQYSYFEET